MRASPGRSIDRRNRQPEIISNILRLNIDGQTAVIYNGGPDKHRVQILKTNLPARQTERVAPRDFACAGTVFFGERNAPGSKSKDVDQRRKGFAVFRKAKRSETMQARVL
jgi:hypothetical protein